MARGFRQADAPTTTHAKQYALTAMLFVPGDSERKLAKALATTADVVIIDLEDAVAPSSKGHARRITSDVLRGERGRPVAVRINALGTDEHLDDLAAIGMLAPDIIMLPKCSGREDVVRLADQLAVLEAAARRPSGATAILPLVTETAAALLNMDYRGTGDRLCGLGFAGEDLSADLGVAPRDSSGLTSLLAHARGQIAIAAAAAGVPAVDTPFPDPNDEEGLLRETRDAAAMGFGGKMCIHPAQVNIVQKLLRPDATTLEWADAVIRAFADAPGDGVTLLDGRMIDRAHLRLAMRYLAQARDLPGDDFGAN